MVSDDRVIYLLFTAQQKLRTYLNAALASEGLRVTYAQAGILFLLKHKSGRSMTELSQYLGTDNSTMTGLVDRLEKAGFVSRNSHPGDRRLSHVYITEAGLAEINRAKTVIRRVNEEVKSGFTNREVDNFKSVLNSFFEKFNIRENKNRP
jgi:DNA-binding MarR family transcriptional regulator